MCHRRVLFPNFADSSPEAQPKYIKGGKRYGRRSLPEFHASVEDFTEVTVIEPLGEEAQPLHVAPGGCEEVSLCFWGLWAGGCALLLGFASILPPWAELLPSLSPFLTSLSFVLPQALLHEVALSLCHQFAK